MSTAAAVSRWLFLLISLSSWTSTYTKETRIVCYYTNWSVYRPGDAKFTPQNINPYMCTHLIYAFGGFTKENTLKPFDKYQDIEKGGYAKFTGLKTYNKNLKTLLAIGGWNEGSTRFSPLVANEDRRKELVKNAIKFLRQNHFDGLDLDWEYPAFRDGGKSRDKDNYAQFVQELREEFERESEKTGRSRLLLTMAVPAGIEYVNKGYNIPKLTRYLDWMNILSYDYHSAFEPAVNHHAPLYSLEEDNEYNYDAELNIDYTIKHYLKLGADPSKLVLGIPTYGRSYTLYNPDAFEIGSPADGPGTMGEATRENGYLAYYEICDYIKNEDWEVEDANPKAMGPYAFKDNQWVGYDDENIIRRKAEYVAENGLGGIMFWAIDNDDFRGKCHGKAYPLIEAGKEALLQAYGITEDNLIAPPAKPIKSRTRSRAKTTEKSIVKAEEKEVKIDKLSNRRRNRNKTTVKTTEVKESEIQEAPKSHRKLRRKQSSTTEESITHSSLKVVTPSYTTPEPPSTPDMGGAFKCEDEGFFPHPKDCKKYFWCLSGAGDSGIIAHQFTCPAGLYFNKAADSCDYTQNVLCNKKLQRPKATAPTSATSAKSSTSTTTSAPTFSTSRAPPKITAATSKTTVRFLTTTEALDEYEEEYEDEDEDDEPPGKTSSKVDSEEDPKVIKELIDLIKKAGGIEQLERQLKLNEKNSSSSGDKTTEPTIGKSLYERVLSKALKNTLNSKKATYTGPRNSSGPQTESRDEDDKKVSLRGKVNKGNLQYSSISRTRPTTTENTKNEDETDDSSKKDISDTSKLARNFKKTNELQYVNIRRGRVSTSTEAPEENSVINRNKILGEESIEEDNEQDDDENSDDQNEGPKKSFTPQYVNIRRQRPSTTEGPSTSKYVEIRRTTTETHQNETDTDESYPKYQTIRRGTTSAPEDEENVEVVNDNQRRRSTQSPEHSTEDSTSKYVNIRRGSTTNNPTTEDQTLIGLIAEKGGITATFVSPNTEAGTSVPETTISSVTKDTVGVLSSSTSESSNTNSTYNKVESIYENTDIKTGSISQQTSTSSRPSLFHIRSSTLKTPTESTTQTIKVSQSNIKFRPRSRADLQTTDANELSTTEKIISSGRRGSSRFRSQTSDSQVAQNEEQPVISIQPKRRIVSTTERIFEENRFYRPSELADLSSLTAVDFEKLKEFNNIEKRHRRRPVRVSTTTTSTTTEKSEESLKTSSRTLPLARKLISSSSFGKSRRIVDTKNHTNSEINYSNIVRTKSTTTESTGTVSSTSFSTPRTRRIIRRFRTTTSSPLTQLDQESKDTKILEDSFSQNITETKKILFKQKQPQLFPLQENKEDDTDDSFEDNVNEEEENIKLSESNIRENSDLNTFGSDQKHKFSGQKTNNIYRGLTFHEQKRIPEFGTKVTANSRSIVEDTGDSTTEPHIVVRTRKIIRKIVPTEAARPTDPVTEHDVSIGRKRKIIRKFRPRFNQINNERDNVTDVKEIPNKNLRGSFSAGFRKSAENKTTHDEPADNVVNITSTDEQLSRGRLVPKRIFRQKAVTERNIAKAGEEVVSTRLRRIKPNNTTEDLLTDDSGNKRNKYIFRTRTSQVTEQNIINISTERPESNFEEDNDTERDSVYLNKPHLVTIQETDMFAENLKDSQTESVNEIIILKGQLEENLSVTDNYINDNEGKFTEGNEEPTTTEYITDVPETTEQRHEPSTTSIPTPSTESLVKRFGAKRQEYKPKFNRAQISTSTETTEVRKLPRYKSFSRRPISSEATESSVNNDNKPLPSTPKINKSRFNSFRFRTSSPRLYDETNDHDNNENRELNANENLNENQIRESEIIRNIKNETNEMEQVNITTESIISNTVIDDSYSTQDTTLFSNEYTTLKNIETTITNEINTSDETGTHITEDTTVFTTMFSSEGIIGEPTSTLVTVRTTETPVQTSKIYTEENETTNEINSENQSTTEVIIPSEETTTDIVSTTSTSPITNLPTTNQREKSTLPPPISRPPFIPSKSRLSTYRAKSKPTLNQLTTEKSNTEKDVSTPSYRRFNKFSGRTSTTQKNIYSQSKFKKTFTRKPNQATLSSSTPIPLNKLFKYSTTRKYNANDDEEYEESLAEDEEEYDQEDNEEDVNDEDDSSISKINSAIQQTEKQEAVSLKKVNRPVFAKKSLPKVVNTPFVSKTTETPEVNKELEDIDTTAIKLRNKNLFTKNRKMNTPFVPHVPSTTQEGFLDLESTTISIKDQETVTPSEEFSTQVNDEQSVTTEYPTTLHHIFADFEENMKTTTEGSNNFIDTTTNKIERLVEVNRIVKVKTKEDVIKNHIRSKQKVNEVDPTLDKIGEVNRVTVIKVVDTNGKLVNNTDISENELNQTIPQSPVYISETTTHPHQPIKSSVDAIIEIAKVQEIPAKVINEKVNLTQVLIEINNHPTTEKPPREERKFEIFGGSKISNFNINNKQPYYGKAEIIDGISHINIITPRPLYHTEASTISLEGLFQTKQSSGSLDKEIQSLKDEILETEHSRFVNVRVLHPDESIRLEKGIRDNSKVIPIKLLKQDDDEVTMRAKVVEVKPVRSSDMIKISPIKIEMFKTVSNNLPIYKEEKQNIPPT